MHQILETTSNIDFGKISWLGFQKLLEIAQNSIYASFLTSLSTIQVFPCLSFSSSFIHLVHLHLSCDFIQFLVFYHSQSTVRSLSICSQHLLNILSFSFEFQDLCIHSSGFHEKFSLGSYVNIMVLQFYSRLGI